MAKKKNTGFTEDLNDDIRNLLSNEFGSDEDNDVKVNFWLPTGCLLLDLAINNGIPGGKVIEIYGKEASGKTQLALSIVKSAQQFGGQGIWLDAEGGLSHSLMDLVGTSRDPKHWVYRLPGSTEKTLAMIEKLIDRCQDSKVPIVIVLDSVAGLCPENQLMGSEGLEEGVRVTGKNGSLLSWFFSRGSVRKMMGKNVFLIFINQVRSQLNFYSPYRQQGPAYTTPGGHSIPFYASVRLECSQVTVEEDEKKRPLQAIQKVKVVKNKVGIPERSARFPFIFRRDSDITGIDNVYTCLAYLISSGVFKANGSWYYLESMPEKKMQKGSWRQAILEDPNLYAEIQRLVTESYRAEYGLSQDVKPVAL